MMFDDVETTRTSRDINYRSARMRALWNDRQDKYQMSAQQEGK